MRRALVLLLAVLAALGLAATAVIGCGTLATRGPSPPLQAAAPAFTLPDHRGGQVSLAELTRRGPALLVFYRGHW